uniref:DUF6512 family protein n=1 Tax=Acetatifactor sp. TaxID=1872090 RepID=UPI004055A06F
MNTLKRYTIIGIIFVLIVGTISHFVYDWSGQNIIIGFFFPINESTWEHMKLVFFPMLLYTFTISKNRNDSSPCITSSFPLGTLVGTFMIPILFYTYSGILGYNLLVLDLLTFALSVLIAFTVAYNAAISCRFEPYEKILKFVVFTITICFFVFTYFPPDIALFENPT